MYLLHAIPPKNPESWLDDLNTKMDVLDPGGRYKENMANRIHKYFYGTLNFEYLILITQNWLYICKWPFLLSKFLFACMPQSDRDKDVSFSKKRCFFKKRMILFQKKKISLGAALSDITQVPKSLAYTSKGCTLVEVLPVPNAYTTSWSKTLKHQLSAEIWCTH